MENLLPPVALAVALAVAVVAVVAATVAVVVVVVTWGELGWEARIDFPLAMD